MKPCIDVPRGWQRVIKSQRVIYISPSHDELTSKEDILQYLTSPGTCKCGLKCPLHLDSLFSFDANIKAKELVNKYGHYSMQNDKPQKTKNIKCDRFEASVGPPVSHTCGLKPNQKENTITNSQVVTNASSDTMHKSVPLIDSGHHYQLDNKNNSLKQKPKLVDTINTSSIAPLPPISVFCKVNTYSVQQIIQILCHGLEKSRSELSNLHYNSISSSLNKSPNLQQSRCISPKSAEKSSIEGHCNTPKQSYSRSTSAPSNVTIKPTIGHIKNQPNSVKPISPLALVTANTTNFEPQNIIPTHKNNMSSLIKSSKKKFKQDIPSSKLQSANIINNSIMSSPTTNKEATFVESPRNDPKRIKNKVTKKPNQIFQLIQNTPNVQLNMNKVQVRQPILTHNQLISQHNMLAAQQSMNQAMLMRLPGSGFNFPYYAHSQKIFHEQPIYQGPVHDERKSKTTKTKSKKTNLNSPNVNSFKQPSIIIQPDNTHAHLDNPTQPTLFVSIGDVSANNKADHVLKKSVKLTTNNPKNINPALDTNCLTSVDSILKTCSNHNPIPDIDEERHGDQFSNNVGKPAALSKSHPRDNNIVTATTIYTQNEPYSTQYLAPVPLIQNMSSSDNTHDIQHTNNNKGKTKHLEKWDGVLSPSEVDAKVQEILSSPQKMEEGSSASDKDGSPKKRKRQQSAPHMYDRYPGNPALRFQAGSVMKAMKLPNKNEISQQGSPSSGFPSSNVPAPVQIKLPPNHPHHSQWNQYQAVKAAQVGLTNQQSYGMFPQTTSNIQLMSSMSNMDHVNQINKQKNK